MAIFLLIFLILLLLYTLLIDYYRRAWHRITTLPTEQFSQVKVSVVVAVRNEEKNIARLLSSLSTQRYAKEWTEVIIVDDHSTDDTLRVISEFENLLPLKCKSLPGGVTSKKKAIECGIEAASGELIITTDADCQMGPDWISAYVSFYKKTGAEFIAAPVSMNGNNSLREVFQRLDFLAMQAITAASVSKQFHTMCNGANIAYTKKAFVEVNGFEGINDIPSGDDMLLMHKIAVAYPGSVMYMKNRESIVFTPAETSWKNFFNQRIRWASKAVHYDDKRIFYVLLLTYLINVSYLVLAIATCVDVRWLSFLLMLLLAKILIEFPFINAAAIFFRQQHLMKFFPLLQPLHIIYVIIAGWLGRFGSYEWKSRIIKNKGKENPVKQ